MDLNRLAGEIDVEAAHRALLATIAGDEPGPASRPAPRPRRTFRRRVTRGFSLGGAGIAVAVAALLLALAGSTGPEVPSAAALTIKRAAQAVEPPAGTILHVDTTLTTRYPSGQSWSTRQDVWQQQDGLVCNYVNLRLSDPASPAGRAGGS